MVSTRLFDQINGIRNENFIENLELSFCEEEKLIVNVMVVVELNTPL